MSTALLRNEVFRFIGRKEPEALAIKGGWGIGKTYAWESYLRQAVAKGQFGLKQYAYVSLFGIDSLDKLKKAIFASTVTREMAGLSPKLENFASNTGALVQRLARKSIPNAKYVPKFKEYSGLLDEISMLSIFDTLICIDDLERIGNGLKLRDVFGLMSQLRDTRGCKVVYIVNDGEIRDPGQKRDFDDYYEKSIDRTLTFKPTPLDLVNLAFTGDSKLDRELRDAASLLGILNLRILKRMEDTVRRIDAILERLDWRVRRQAIRSAVLFSWVVQKGRGAPSEAQVKGRKPSDYFMEARRKDERNDDEKRIDAMLTTYEFGHCDELDLSIFSAIETGIFADVEILNEAKKLDAGYKAGDRGQVFNDAWDLFHYSLDDNANEIVAKLVTAFEKAPEFITPMNASSSLELVEQLSDAATADRCLAAYVGGRGDDPNEFDLAEMPFGNEVRYQKLREALTRRLEELSPLPTIGEVISLLANRQVVQGRHLDALAIASDNDLFTAIKTASGEKLRYILKGLLERPLFSDADVQDAFFGRMQDVARRIAGESAINTIRLTKWGVMPGAKPPQYPSGGGHLVRWR